MQSHHLSNRHEFALYAPCIDSWGIVSQGNERVIDDEALCLRIHRVLRLHEHEMVQLFGTLYNIVGELVVVQAHRCILKVMACNVITPLKPRIQLALPLIEKSAFEEAVSWATILGVEKITPYIAAKSKRHEFAHSEMQRLMRVMIAAAEQSKQYSLPTIGSVVPFAHISHQDSMLIAFDIRGGNICRVMQAVELSKRERVTVLCGPEGDWASDERNMLISWGASMSRLTPTILRTEHAIAVGIGVLRSLWS